MDSMAMQMVIWVAAGAILLLYMARRRKRKSVI